MDIKQSIVAFTILSHRQCDQIDDLFLEYLTISNIKNFYISI